MREFLKIITLGVSFAHIMLLIKQKICGIFNKSEENLKTPLTKEARYDRINKLSARGTERDGGEKFFKKLLKNLLTNEKRCDIIIESPRE